MTDTTNTISAAATLVLPTVEAPLHWRELQGHISQLTPTSLSKLGRSAAQLAVYVEHRAKVLLTWRSMQDYVVWRVFGGLATAGEGTAVPGCAAAASAAVTAGSCSAAVTDSPLGKAAREGAGHSIHFRANEFPYHLAPELSHDNLWSTQPLAPDRVQLLLEGFLPGRELLWWENPPALKSVPGPRDVHPYLNHTQLNLPSRLLQQLSTGLLFKVHKDLPEGLLPRYSLRPHQC
ncbi:MAG: hypothetical protein WDW38_007410 [Sanguina aurantia]